LAFNTIRQPKHWQIRRSFDKFFKTDVNNVRAPNLELNCIAWIHLISFGCTIWIPFENCRKRSLFPMEMDQKKVHAAGKDGLLANQNWNAPIRWSMINVNAKWDFGLHL
jgi:hypothetical protein